MTRLGGWKRLGAVLASIALVAGCGSGDDDADEVIDDIVEDGPGDPDTDPGESADDATALGVDEQVAIVCSAWGTVVPAAPVDAVESFAELVRDDAPADVLDALAELAVDGRDPAIVEDRLVAAATYVDPLCGTDTALVLDQLATPAACAVEDTGVDDPGTPLDTTVVDVDLDGVDDTAVLSLLDDGTLRLVVTLATADVLSLQIVDEMLFSEGPLRVETAADVEGDGDGDLWLVIGAGSSTELFTLILTDGCTLHRPTAGDALNAFSVGASLGNVDGIECVDIDGNGVLDGFHQYRGEAGAEPGTYGGRILHWVVDGLELVLLDDDTFVTGPDDPNQRAYGAFSCF